MSFGRFSVLAGSAFAGLLSASVALAQQQPASAAPAASAPVQATPAAQAAAAPAAGTEVTPLPVEPAPTVAQTTEAHGPATPGDAKAGATKAAACAACHGADGNSADPQYPKLAGQQERYIARQLALFKTGERDNPIMRPFAAPLSPQDMRDIGAHFAAQTSLPGVADETVIAQGPNSGKKFYQVGETLWQRGNAARGVPACMACHGAAGHGNPGPPYPSIAGQHAGYTQKQLEAFRAGLALGEGTHANSIMAGVAKYLTDEEIRSLATYVEGLHAVSGEAAAAHP